MAENRHIAKERRNFLKRVAAAGSSAALVAMTREAASSQGHAPEQVPEKASSQGYRETPHVKDFYASLRI